MKSSPQNSPRHHTKKIKIRLGKLIEHLRKDIKKISEPKAQALFETSAEMLNGLVKAFGDYENKIEAAWRTEPKAPRTKGKTNHASR